MSFNVAFNVIQASGPRSVFSTEAPDPSDGERRLSNITGTVELSGDESKVTYRDIGWTRPRAIHRFTIDGAAIQVEFDPLTVSQLSPVTVPVLTNIGRKITTAGLSPSRDLSFSNANLTGRWSINGGEQAGAIRLSAEALTKPAFGLISVARSGSLAVGAITDLAQQGEPGQVGGFVRYAYEQRLFRGMIAGDAPIELRLHLVVDRVRVSGRLENRPSKLPTMTSLQTGMLFNTQHQPQH